MNEFSIKVPYSIDEVKQKIESQSRDFNCEKSYGEIIISYPIKYKNDFAPNLYLTFTTTGNETVINGHLKLRNWVRIFNFFWFSFAGIAAIAVFISIINEISRGEKSYLELRFVLIPIGMILFALLLIKFGRFTARKNTEEILDWVFSLFPDRVSIKNEK